MAADHIQCEPPEDEDNGLLADEDGDKVWAIHDGSGLREERDITRIRQEVRD